MPRAMSVVDLVDIVFSSRGSVVVFTPLTAAAEEWLATNVEIASYQWHGPSFVADHRPAWELLRVLKEEGTLRVAEARVLTVVGGTIH